VGFSKFSQLGDWLEFAFEVSVQLVVVALVFALSGVLWPDELLATPLSAIKLQDLLLAAGSVLVAGVGLLMSHFVVAEPIRAMLKARKRK
jgi:hypothetical protein